MSGWGVNWADALIIALVYLWIGLCTAAFVTVLVWAFMQ